MQRYIRKTFYSETPGHVHNPNNNFNIVPPSSVLDFLLRFTRPENITGVITTYPIPKVRDLPNVQQHPAPLASRPPPQPVPQSLSQQPVQQSNSEERRQQRRQEEFHNQHNLTQIERLTDSSGKNDYSDHDDYTNDDDPENVKRTGEMFSDDDKLNDWLDKQLFDGGGLIKGGSGPSPLVFILKILATLVCCIAVVALVSVVLKTFTGKGLDFAGIKIV